MITAFYARVSGDRQKEEKTISSQLQELRDFAAKEDLEIDEKHIYLDEAESGYYLDRTGLDALRDAARDGLIDMIMDNPSLEGVNREILKKGAVKLRSLPDGGSFPLAFGTRSGKIELYAEHLAEDGEALPVYLPPIEAPITSEETKYPLTLISGHSRFRTHSMFANVHSLLDLNPEPLVDINPIDAEKRNILDNDIVTVFNNRARTTLKVRVTDGAKERIVPVGKFVQMTL